MDTIIPNQKPASESNGDPRHSGKTTRIAAAFGVNVEMRLGTVPGVADATETLADPHTVSCPNYDASLHQVSQIDRGPLAFDRDIVTGAILRISIGRRAINESVDYCRHHSIDRAHDFRSPDCVPVGLARIEPESTYTRTIQHRDIESVTLRLIGKVDVNDFRSTPLAHMETARMKWKRKL
jgi:hypothetical protein